MNNVDNLSITKNKLALSSIFFTFLEIELSLCQRYFQCNFLFLHFFSILFSPIFQMSILHCQIILNLGSFQRYESHEKNSSWSCKDKAGSSTVLTSYVTKMRNLHNIQHILCYHHRLTCISAMPIQF